MYKIIFTESALKDINKLENHIKQQIGIKLKSYCEAPYNFARKLSNFKIGTYRFRIGDYRVIFDVDIQNLVILRIGHRKEIYK